MKTHSLTAKLCLGLGVLAAPTFAQTPASPQPEAAAIANTAAATSTTAPVVAPASAATTNSAATSVTASSVASPGVKIATAPVPSDAIRFNFRGAPLEQVLNYLSEAAGYTIVLETSIRGTVDMWSAQPVPKSEVVPLLNLAINRQGYTASLTGHTLVVSSKEDAKKRSIPIRTGNDPQEIPANAEMVMQIIPLRNISAANAARDLGSLLPSTSNILANEDSNSLIVTDTQMNVRHVVEIVASLDGSDDAINAMKVYQLHNADPVELATTLNSLFSSNTSSSNRSGQQTQTNPFQGGPGGMFGMMAANFANRGNGGTGGTGGRSSSSSTRKSSGSFYAVADQRTRAVIITASREMFPQIAELIAQLDTGNARNQKVYVYTLENANVKQVETMLKNLFQNSNTRSTSSSTQTDPLTTRASNNSQTTSSTTLTSTSSSSSSR